MPCNHFTKYTRKQLIFVFIEKKIFFFITSLKQSTLLTLTRKIHCNTLDVIRFSRHINTNSLLRHNNHRMSARVFVSGALSDVVCVCISSRNALILIACTHNMIVSIKTAIHFIATITQLTHSIKCIHASNSFIQMKMILHKYTNGNSFENRMKTHSEFLNWINPLYEYKTLGQSN